MKIVINDCFGGFSLSKQAQEELGITTPYPDIPRNDPRLVDIVERLGDAANGDYAELKIVEIPDDATTWYVDDHDGAEVIREGRVWD